MATPEGCMIFDDKTMSSRRLHIATSSSAADPSEPVMIYSPGSVAPTIAEELRTATRRHRAKIVVYVLQSANRQRNISRSG
ncbi:hypothetical protein ZHAS_00011170 [Anopheles sinensis]|uniref:Uncharacterized protein n=1 Tax=Anopheles sinensis TaxID=74873 RepID=A0A084VZH6_ANOSI|nr:hypothetical protein ZHAS_00011170 [Anopheles sinensis]